MTYMWTCNKCTEEGINSVYLGETARSLWDRTVEHPQKLKARSEQSALWKHWSQYHQSEEEPDFSVKKTGKFKTCTERQIREALAIDGGKQQRLMNSKKEYGSNCIVRQSVVFRDSLVEDRQQVVGTGEEAPGPEERRARVREDRVGALPNDEREDFSMQY